MKKGWLNREGGLFQNYASKGELIRKRGLLDGGAQLTFSGIYTHNIANRSLIRKAKKVIPMFIRHQIVYISISGINICFIAFLALLFKSKFH